MGKREARAIRRERRKEGGVGVESGGTREETRVAILRDYNERALRDPSNPRTMIRKKVRAMLLKNEEKTGSLGLANGSGAVSPDARGQYFWVAFGMAQALLTLELRTPVTAKAVVKRMEEVYRDPLSAGADWP